MDPVVVVPLGGFATMTLIILVFYRSRFTTVAVCILLMLAAASSVTCHGSPGDFLTCVSPSYLVVLLGFCVTFYGGVFQDDRRRSKACGAIFEESWRDVCHVLDEGHEHAGGLIRGRYEGHPVQAQASYLDLEPQASPLSVYELSVIAGRGGGRWSARPKRVARSWRDWTWEIHARPKDFQKQLAGAGIVEALDAQPHLWVGGNPKISYDPARETLKYTDESGSVPDAGTFRGQLKTLIALKAINTEHNVGAT